MGGGEEMDHLAWLGRQYRALLIRESYLLDRMLLLSLIERAEGEQYAELEEELRGLGRYQSNLARTIGAVFEFRFPSPFVN